VITANALNIEAHAFLTPPDPFCFHLLQVRPMLHEHGHSSPGRQVTNQSLSLASQDSTRSQDMFEAEEQDVHSWEVGGTAAGLVLHVPSRVLVLLDAGSTCSMLGGGRAQLACGCVASWPSVGLHQLA
jgi:hypothetical protein